MKTVIEAQALSKHYSNFSLRDAEFQVPQGMVTGLIGENGAGKTTLIKLMMGAIFADSGKIRVFGREPVFLKKEEKECIGFVLEEGCFPPELTMRDMEAVMRGIYRNWDREFFFSCIERLGMQEEMRGRKKIRIYSKGMKAKLALAIALSHGTKLLIVDEATSGLDPVIRSEILDMFLEFMQEEDHSILMSSHILSDLEKICDHLIYIREGKILFQERRDRIDQKYGVLKCSREQFAAIAPAAVIGKKENAFGVEALLRREAAGELPLESASIEELMIYYSSGGAR